MRPNGRPLIAASMVRLAALSLFLAPVTGSGQAFRTEAIQDPALNMKAYDIVIPAGWKYQGTLMPGSSCDGSPSPVFRAYSQDGLSEFRGMPRFDWSWSNAPYAMRPSGDCLPLKKDVSAVEFLHYLANDQRAKYDDEMPLDPRTAQTFRQAIDVDNAAIQARAGVRPFRGDAGAARVEYQNGSFVIEEQLRVLIRCSHFDLPSLGNQGPRLFREQCGANVRVLRAPKGKLDALVNLIDGNRTGAIPDDHWTQAYIAATQAATNQIVGSIRANMAAQQKQFEQAQTVRAHQNEQFQANLQAGYAADNAHARQTQDNYATQNANAMANMNARHTPASDVVDFALDQQTVSGTGGTVKVPAGYSQVWANNNGQHFVTNDLNTNPNGVLPGNWTQQTQVHGNGQPY
jgi:hypothetical protein